MRYLLFSGFLYYPEGGWDDFDGAFETLEAAVASARARQHDTQWWHVVDTVTREVVARQHTADDD